MNSEAAAGTTTMRSSSGPASTVATSPASVSSPARAAGRSGRVGEGPATSRPDKHGAWPAERQRRRRIMDRREALSILVKMASLVLLLAAAPARAWGPAAYDLSLTVAVERDRQA